MRLLGSALAVVLALCSVPAAATPLWVDGEPTDFGGCNLVRAEVTRWSPSDGPPVAFIAERFLQNAGGNALILLGADAQGFWSAEMRSESDACDECDVLHLVHTSFAGKRQSYLVTEAMKLAELELSPDARRARVKQALFRLAAGPWQVSKLSQQYRLTLPRHDGEGRLARYTGWFAEARVARQPGLRFGVHERNVMCWCMPSWRGYALRA